MSNQLDIDQLFDDLNIEEENKSVEEKSSTDLTVSNPAELQVAIDPNIVYGKLNNLVDTGDKLLKTAQYLIDAAPDADNIASTASLITSVKDVIKEFTVLHRDKMRFEQQKELERFKAEQKEKLLRLRINSDKAVTQPGEGPIDVVEFSQEAIIEKLAEMESSKE